MSGSLISPFQQPSIYQGSQTLRSEMDSVCPRPGALGFLRWEHRPHVPGQTLEKGCHSLPPCHACEPTSPSSLDPSLREEPRPGVGCASGFINIYKLKIFISAIQPESYDLVSLGPQASSANAGSLATACSSLPFIGRNSSHYCSGAPDKSSKDESVCP